MKTRHFILGVLVLVGLAALGGGGWWLAQANAAAATTALEATGVIEARTVLLASEVGGRVVAVLVEEGQRVTAGQPLVRLDDALLRTQRAQAEAALKAAQANLALLEAGATEAQLNAAEAQLAQSEASLRLARAALDAATPGARPEDLAAARAALDRAWGAYRALVVVTGDQLDEALAAVTTAESNLSQAEARRADLAKSSHNPDYALPAADLAIADAQAALDAARRAYAAAQDEAQPYSVQIQLARLSWDVAQSNVTQAQARRDSLAGDARTPAEALTAAEDTLADAQRLAEAAQAAYEALTSGASATMLNAAWAEVQRAFGEVQVREYAWGMFLIATATKLPDPEL